MTATQEKDLEFRLDLDHKYWYGSRRVLGATEVLRIVGITDDSWFTEESRRRGHFVHKCALLIARDDLDEEATKKLHPEWWGFVEAYKRFLKETGFVPDPMRCEVPLFHSEYWYGVTPDQPGVLANQDIVAELKTGGCPEEAALQTAAQAMALWPLDYYQKPRMAAELHDDGTWKPVRFSNLSDFDYFLGALAAARWKLEHGLVKEDK